MAIRKTCTWCRLTVGILVLRLLCFDIIELANSEVPLTPAEDNSTDGSGMPIECPEETLGIILWPYTEPGDVAIQPCFSNNSTTIAAKRVCFHNGSWAEPDTTNCSAAIPVLQLVEPGGQYEVNAGSQFTLLCITEQYPVTSLAWFKLGNSTRLIEEANSNFSSNLTLNLTIHQVSLNDSGIYLCVASNQYATNNITANILVLRQCPAENRSSIFWPITQQGVQVVRQCFSRFPELSVTRVCFENGSWSELDISNCTNAVPQLTLSPPGGQYEVNAGSSLSVQCTSNSYPISSLAWFQEGNTEPIASLNLPTMPMSASLNLSIIQEQPFASGIYVCVATTPYLKSNVTANITIINFCPRETSPELRFIWPETRQGQTVELPCFAREQDLYSIVATRKCRADGNWTTPDIALCSNAIPTLHIIQVFNRGLIIDRPLPFEETLGNDGNEVLVGAPFLAGDEPLGSNIPLGTQPQTFTVEEGSRLYLVCIPGVYPVFNIRWFRVIGSVFTDVITEQPIHIPELKRRNIEEEVPFRHQEAELRIFGSSESSGLYACTANTIFTSISDVPVFVTINISVISTCPQSTTGDIFPGGRPFVQSNRNTGIFEWQRTRVGQLAEQLCFPNTNITLMATRLCLENGSWAEPNVNNCLQALPKAVLTAPDHIEEGRRVSIKCTSAEYPVAILELFQVSGFDQQLIQSNFGPSIERTILHMNLDEYQCTARNPYGFTNASTTITQLRANFSGESVSQRFRITFENNQFQNNEFHENELQNNQILENPFLLKQILPAQVLQLIPESENGIQEVLCRLPNNCVFPVRFNQLRVECNVSSYPQVNSTINLSENELKNILNTALPRINSLLIFPDVSITDIAIEEPLESQVQAIGQRDIVGSKLTLEVQRRLTLACSFKINGSLPVESSTPVITGWHTTGLPSIDEYVTMLTSNRCGRIAVAKRNVFSHTPFLFQITIDTDTIERTMNYTCLSIGEFGYDAQVVTINVAYPSGNFSVAVVRFLFQELNIPLITRRQTRESKFKLFDLEQRVLEFTPESFPGIQTVKCIGKSRFIRDMEYVAAECNITSHNTTQEEFWQIVSNTNRTLNQNMFPVLNIVNGSVLIGIGGFCLRDSLVSQLYGSYIWPETGGNTSAMLACRFGAINGEGFAVRKCLEGGIWDTLVDYSQCRDSLPYIETTVLRGPESQGSNLIVVEQGRFVRVMCTASMAIIDPELSIQWYKYINGSRVIVPDFASFFENFFDVNNSSNTNNLDSQAVRKGLRPNATLDEATRLYSLRDPDLPFSLALTSASTFKSSTNIGGVYTCEATNSFGSRSVNVTIEVQAAVGESSLVYIRALTSLLAIDYAGILTLSSLEARVLELISIFSIGLQTVECSIVPFLESSGSQFDRVECVIRQFPPVPNGIRSVGTQVLLSAAESRQIVPGSGRVSETGFCNFEQTNSDRFGMSLWPETEGGFIFRTPCSINEDRMISRTCLTGGIWIAVNYSNCSLVNSANSEIQLRFSTELQNILSGGGTNEGAVENIENVIFEMVGNVTSVDCVEVPPRKEDVAVGWNRVECTFEIIQNNSTFILGLIADVLQSNNFSINGTEINASNGFCSSEIINGGLRGVFQWEETRVNTNISLPCVYGPPSILLERSCVSKDNLTFVSIDQCWTVVRISYASIENRTRNTTNFNDLMSDLTITVNMTTQVIDQNTVNIQVVQAVFAETAAQVQSLAFMISVEETVENAIDIIDDIEEWPKDVVGKDGNRIVQAYESIVRALIKQENFTNITIIGDDIAFRGERIPRNQYRGRTFSASNTPILTIRTKDASPRELSTGELVSITLPESINNIIPANEDIRMGFTVYRETDHRLFPARDSSINNSSVIGSSIISAQVAGIVDGTELDTPVQLFFLLNDLSMGSPDQTVNRRCVFWNFTAAGGLGDWDGSGCTLQSFNEANNTARCECNHLTNFAILIDISARKNNRTVLPLSFAKALEITSYIGIVLSIVGLLILIVTYTAFKKLRVRDVSKFHVQFALALLGMVIVFVIGIDRTANKAGCITVGVLLHYLLLVAWMWMAAEALLLFQKLVIVFVKVTTKYLIIVSIACWAIPLIPVIVTLGVNVDHYIMEPNNQTGAPGFCFISDTGFFIGALLALVFLVILFNTCVFISSVYVLVKHNLKRHKGRMNNKSKTILLKDSCKLIMSLIGLMTLLGLTWILSLFTIIEVDTSRDAAFALRWIFVFFNSLQGFFLFIFFVVLSSDARNEWVNVICSLRKAKEPSTSNIRLQNTIGNTQTKAKSYTSSATREGVVVMNDYINEEHDTTVSYPDVITADSRIDILSEDDMTGEKIDDDNSSKRDFDGRLLKARIKRSSTKAHHVWTAEVDFDENN